MTLSDPPQPKRWWRLALVGQFALVFGAVALSSPGRIDIVDGQTRYEVARSVVEHGDSVIRDPNVWLHVYPGRDGNLYSDYRFPQSALGIAAIHVADATGPVSELRRQFFFTLASPLATALLALAYAVFFRWCGLGPKASLIWSTLGIVCTPSWFYGTSTYDDILGTAGLISAFVVAFVARERRPLLGAIVSGLLLAWVVNCKQPLGLFALPVLIAGHATSLTRRRQCLRVGIVLGGMLLGMMAYKAYDLYKFPPGSDEEYGNSFNAVWVSSPLPGLASMALSPNCCMFLYCPTMILGIAGWRRWRGQERWLCGSVLLSSALFMLFISFLSFYKGGPCWGPRYLTPVFALWWLFVPAAVTSAPSLRFALAPTPNALPCFQRARNATALLLGAGCLVQVLALSVETQRLWLQLPCPFTWYEVDPWLDFHPGLSNVLQRPREIAEILAHRGERASSYSPAPFATYATTIPSLAADDVASAVGLMMLPEATHPLATPPTVLRMKEATQVRVHFPRAARDYHVFASWRPWILSQTYLAPEDRPVDLMRALILLLCITASGLGVMLFALGRCRRPETADGSLVSAAAMSA